VSSTAIKNIGIFNAGVSSFDMTALEIQKMPRRGKLKLMESLWADLSRDEVALESPARHGDALRETSERRARGEETLLNWEEVKTKLPKEKRSQVPDKFVRPD
jgi:hypothetical protein